MKSVLFVLCSVLISFSAEAGPRFLNANLQSKTLGSFLVSLKVDELPLPIVAQPETLANIDRDNGQIVAMNCVTTAKFAEVGVMDITVFSPSAPVFQNRILLDLLLANSYGMGEPDEACNSSPLHNLTKASIASPSWNFVVPVKVGSEILSLGIAILPFSPQLDVLVSGDENQMSLDWLDLFSASSTHKRTMNFSVYKQEGATTSYLEHGSSDFEVR